MGVEVNEEGSVWGVVKSKVGMLVGLCVVRVCVGSRKGEFDDEVEGED